MLTDVRGVPEVDVVQPLAENDVFAGMPGELESVVETDGEVV